jgi:hypothetical protein
MINYHIPNQDGKSYESNNNGFSALDYNLPIDGLNISEIHLSKRYPTDGFALNTKSKMMVRVLEGGVSFCRKGL